MSAGRRAILAYAIIGDGCRAMKKVLVRVLHSEFGLYKTMLAQAPNSSERHSSTQLRTLQNNSILVHSARWCPGKRESTNIILDLIVMNG